METKQQDKGTPCPRSNAVLLVRDEHCQTSPLGGISLSTLLPSSPPSTVHSRLDTTHAPEVRLQTGSMMITADVIVIIEGG